MTSPTFELSKSEQSTSEGGERRGRVGERATCPALTKMTYPCAFEVGNVILMHALYLRAMCNGTGMGQEDISGHTFTVIFAMEWCGRV